MAKIAILGSSYSAALIDWRNKNFDINDYKDDNIAKCCLDITD